MELLAAEFAACPAWLDTGGVVVPGVATRLCCVIVLRRDGGGNQQAWWVADKTRTVKCTRSRLHSHDGEAAGGKYVRVVMWDDGVAVLSRPGSSEVTM